MDAKGGATWMPVVVRQNLPGAHPEVLAAMHRQIDQLARTHQLLRPRWQR